MRRLTPILFLAAAASAGAGDLDARWSPGAQHCDATPAHRRHARVAHRQRRRRRRGGDAAREDGRGPAAVVRRQAPSADRRAHAPSGSSDHPGQRTLVLTRQDLEGLPAALAGFNGFYSKYPNYAIVNPVRNLLVVAAGSTIVIALAVWGLRRLWRRRKVR
jgi:hypothetical protein